MFLKNIPMLKEEAFAEAWYINDDGTYAGARATGSGARPGGSYGRGPLARHGHRVGDCGGGPGALHASGVRDARGRLLPDEERWERGRQNTRQPRDRGPPV